MKSAMYDFPPSSTEPGAGVSSNYYDKSFHANNGLVVNENRPYCRGIFDFTSQFKNELSFSAGDIIYLLRSVNGEWLEGELQANSSRGIFPLSFVEIVVGLDEIYDRSLESEHTNPAELSVIGVASVLYDFTSRFPDELTVKAGESLNIIQILGTEWIKCQNPVTGESGLVPQNFLHLFLNESLESNTLTDEDSTFHQEIPWLDWSKTGSGISGECLMQQPHGRSRNPSENESLNTQNASHSLHQNQPPPRPPPPKLETKQDKPFIWINDENANDKSSTIIAPSLPDVQFYNREIETNEKVQNNSSIDNKRDRIIQDLLNTEMSYLKEMTNWEECIKTSKLDAMDKQTLIRSIPVLRELSQSLIEAINKQKANPTNDQFYGQMFMTMKEKFYKTFAQHFHSVEEISALVENETDNDMQKALQMCLMEMKKRGMVVFDVPTMVSRPIHRCLKYPLYVGELIKHTPLNHPDHPKLLESLKQLSNLASKMNECKRRKELVRKYRQNEQLSLADRIGRLNMHTFRKKGNRLKYRIASRTIGFGTVKDNEFDHLINLLEDAERRVCKFMYCAQLYRKYIESSVRKYEEFCKNICSVQDENMLKDFAQHLRKIGAITREHLAAFDNDVLNEGKKLVRNELNKLIRKRNDKLADYETANASFNSTGKSMLEELDVRKNEFEALNNQVKVQLPRTIGMINSKVIHLVKKVRELDTVFLRKMDSGRNSVEFPLRYCPQQPFYSFLPPGHRQSLSEMDKILHQLQKDTTLMEKTTIDQKKQREKKKTTKLMKRMSMRNGPRRQQTVKERDALIKICKAQNQVDLIRRVLKDYGTDSFVIRRGDVVVVKGHHSGFSLCDNAVNTHYVPSDYLAQYDESFIIGGDRFLGTAAEKGGSTNKISQDSSNKIIDLEQHENPPNTRLRIPQKPNEFHFPTNEASITLPKTRKSSLDLIDLDENLINFLEFPHTSEKNEVMSGTSTIVGQSKETTNIIDDPLDDFFVQYDKEPSARRDKELRQQTFLLSPAQNVSNSSIGHIRPSSIIISSNNILKEDPFAKLFDMAKSNFSVEKRVTEPLSKNSRPLTPRTRESPSEIPDIPNRPDCNGFSLPSADPFHTGHLKFGSHHPPLPPPLPLDHEYVFSETKTNYSASSSLSPSKNFKGTKCTDQLDGVEDANTGIDACMNFPVMKCAYDFQPDPTDTGHLLAINQGEFVNVLKKSDDAGNSEWWLVQLTNNNRTGFVPSSYLSQIL